MKINARPMWLCCLTTSCLMVNCYDVYAQEKNAPQTEQSKTEQVIEVVATRPEGIAISSKQMSTMPGGLGDPLKALDALPGVVLATPSSGGPVAQPAIRGSSPRDNQYLSDFLPVGYVFHQDSLSTFNPELIESFELKTSGWSGQYNDAIGGVITTQLRDPSFDESQLVLDLSMIRSGILFESPLTDKTAFYLSYRESLIHNFVDDIIEDEDFTFSQPPRNHDYQAKFAWDINPNNTLKIVSTGAEDKVRQAYKEGAAEVARNPDLAIGEGFSSDYSNVGVIWLNDSDLGDTTAAVNFLTSNLSINEGIAEQSSSEVDELLIKSNTITPLENGTLHWGGEYKQQNITQTNTSRLQSCNSEFSTCLPTSFAPIVDDITEVDVSFVSVFSHWQHQINENWQTEIGALINSNNFTDETLFEPRLSAQYRLSDSSNINFSLGSYHQWFRNYNYLSPVFGNPGLDQSKANMFGLSYDKKLSHGWQWKFDLYYKRLSDLVIANPAAQLPSLVETVDGSASLLAEPQFVNDGEGTAWGAELMVNKALTDNWYGWFSLAYAHTERENKQTNQSFDYEFDIPIITTLVTNYKFNDNWQLGAKWLYQSGRRYTEVLGADPIYPLVNGEPDNTQEPIFYQPNYGDFNAERRDAGHRLDVRLDYFTSIAQYPVNVYVDILNLYGHQKIQEDEWNLDYTDSTDDYEFPDETFVGLGLSIRF
ncbi:MAG: TonB-dependent receptor plug domain-containing protein [Kangiellaceae bacterium]|nr:TonB-dependent receptor plug domain-containing protein [Kangiellaceae bacterium]